MRRKHSSGPSLRRCPIRGLRRSGPEKAKYIFISFCAYMRGEAPPSLNGWTAQIEASLGGSTRKSDSSLPTASSQSWAQHGCCPGCQHTQPHILYIIKERETETDLYTCPKCTCGLRVQIAWHDLRPCDHSSTSISSLNRNQTLGMLLGSLGM